MTQEDGLTDRALSNRPLAPANGREVCGMTMAGAGLALIPASLLAGGEPEVVMVDPEKCRILGLVPVTLTSLDGGGSSFWVSIPLSSSLTVNSCCGC